MMGNKTNAEHNPMISVIIPVYNAEKYIADCLDSVLAQTFMDYEIICVDDGSTDHSYDIICDYAHKYNCIKVLQQHNQYAGVARNNGLKESQGEYLYFLDSDDFIAPELLEKTITKAEPTNADIVAFDGVMYETNTKDISVSTGWLDSSVSGGKEVFSRKDCPEEILTFSNPAPWTKLYRKEFVVKNNLEFQATPSANDLLFSKLAYAVAERITCLDEKLVFYRYGMAVNTQSKKHRYGFPFMDAMKGLYSELQKRQILDEVKSSYQALFINCLHYELSPFGYSGDKAKAYECVFEDELTREMLSAENTLSDGIQRNTIQRRTNDLRRWKVAYGFHSAPANELGEIELVNEYYNTYKQLVERYIDNCGCVNWYVQYASIKQQMDAALNQTRTAYRNLQPEEKQFYLGYDKQEWPMFERLIVDYVNKENELQAARTKLQKTEKS